MVNVVMTDGRVSNVNYVGDTGGPITQGEQCAFAVRNCVSLIRLAFSRDPFRSEGAMQRGIAIVFR
jgi:hypothetical protein